MIESEVKGQLQENDLLWEDFKNWMIGQTVGILKNGEADYYSWDVIKYIHFKLKNQEPPMED